MNKTVGIVMALLVVIIVAAVLFVFNDRRSGVDKVSRFGKYRGYSEADYDGYVRRSDYLTLEDGTRLAYDLLIPTRKGAPAGVPLPALFNYTPYLRTMTIIRDGEVVGGDLFGLGWLEKTFLWLRARLSEDGHLLDPAFRAGWLKTMLEHGYAVIVIERHGTGASFGVLDPSFEAAAREADEILDWIAAQPWSDGNVGMYGDSWQAMVQFAAASTGNPHLKAIFPCSGGLDLYAVSYPGGIYNQAFNTLFSRATSALETLITPVDGDEDGVLLGQALAERLGSTVGEESREALSAFSLRDSTTSKGTRWWEDVMGLYFLLEQVNRSGVPIYGSNGWFDLFTRDMFLWHANLTVPRRLHVRPLDHGKMGDSGADLDYGAEALRWFDYWLKGIDNGIMDEPPIHYYVMGAPGEEAWRFAEQWPLPGQQVTRFYLAGGRTGSVNSVNDGFLRPDPPGASDAYDAYEVDYSTTSGPRSRWAAVLEPADYPDMRANDEKALTYTTPPLETDVEVTGHPVVSLCIVTDAPDVDLFVYLEEVDRRGRSTYVTEGVLRASHRALGEPPFDNLGLPYHRSYESDVSPIPAGEPVELTFDLLPTSRLFRQGHRIRVTVACADADNFDTAAPVPLPEIHLLRNATHASFVELPVIPAR